MSVPVSLPVGLTAPDTVAGAPPGPSPSGLPPPERTPLPPGTSLADGRYILGATLGSGGFGITYAAVDQRLRRGVAVKELFPDGAHRLGWAIAVDGAGVDRLVAARERFRREATTLARFAHPNIVRVFEVFEANETLYIVLERLEGATLAAELRRRRGPMTEAEALDVAAQVGAALDAVHRAGVLHRDVSPSNLVRTTDGRVVLIDFGLARPYDDARTTTMTRIVTPGYSSPEQYRGAGRFSARSDVYALGASLYRLLSGEVPPAASNHAMAAQPQELWRINPTVSRRVSDAVDAALRLDPADRPPDIAALLHRLGASPTFGALIPPGLEPDDVATEAVATEAIVAHPQPSDRHDGDRSGDDPPRSWRVPAPGGAGEAGLGHPPWASPAARASGEPWAPPSVPSEARPPVLEPAPWDAVADPVPARRRLVTVPLGAAAVALAMAQPITATALLGLVVAPVVATVGDRIALPHRHPARLVGWLLRNTFVAVGRTLGAGVVLALGLGLWAVTDAVDLLDAAAPWVLRLTGATTGWMLARSIGRGGPRFRSDVALDHLAERVVPGGRLSVGSVAYLLAVGAVIAGLLAFPPEAWPLR